MTVDLEDLGTYRLPNAWEAVRIRHIRDRGNRALAALAFPLGMSVRQFKRLPAEQQQAVRRAYLILTAPGAAAA